MLWSAIECWIVRAATTATASVPRSTSSERAWRSGARPASQRATAIA